MALVTDGLQNKGLAPLAPGVVGQALYDGAALVSDGRYAAQVVVVQVAGAAGRLPVERAAAADVQGDGLPACAQVVPVFGAAVGADFLLVGEAQAVFTVEVPGVAAVVAADSVAAQGDVLFDALVLGAVQEAQGAVGAGDATDQPCIN